MNAMYYYNMAISTSDLIIGGGVSATLLRSCGILLRVTGNVHSLRVVRLMVAILQREIVHRSA